MCSEERLSRASLAKLLPLRTLLASSVRRIRLIKRGGLVEAASFFRIGNIYTIKYVAVSPVLVCLKEY